MGLSHGLDGYMIHLDELYGLIILVQIIYHAPHKEQKNAPFYSLPASRQFCQVQCSTIL